MSLDPPADEPAAGPAPTTRTTPALLPALWPEVSALFDDALSLPASERPEWLAALDAARPVVALHLRRLLAAHHTEAKLPMPEAELLAAALGASTAALVAGQQIGIYRLLEPLGAGGMATVWAAEQTQGVFRRVALKLPHAGIEAPAAMARRFESERDLLASLEHPHIARLYDAGIAAAGQPFLAMELIEGRPLTEHARGLPLRRRLALFLQVLEAVSFAHGRLVIHRDLKPSNLLVTPQGQVKLLDFGIARLLESENTEADAAPGPLSGRAFTPDCASPEQLAGLPLGVASDVYSLGVVLYELLAGQRPYALDRHCNISMVDQLAAKAVQPPSEVARAQASSSAPARDLARSLRGDLDAIVACAMARDPARRYASVEAMAADLQRHLDLQPVRARGGGRSHRLLRALRRHRVAVAAGALVLLSMGSGLGVALWQAQEARAQMARAQSVKDLLLGFFDGVSPEHLRGVDISARELVLQGSARAEAALRDEPLLRADLLHSSGELLLRLEAYQPAAERLQQALTLFESQRQEGSVAAIEARIQLAEALNLDTGHAAAQQALERASQLAALHFGAAHRWQMRLAVERARIALNQGQPELAVAAAGRALAMPGDGAPDQRRLALSARYILGSAQRDLGKYLEARSAYDQVLADAPAVPTFPLASVLNVRISRLTTYGMAGDFGTVARESLPLLADSERLLGPAAETTSQVREMRAAALMRLGQYEQAVALQREVVRLSAETQAADPEVWHATRAMLGQFLAAAGDAGEGLPLVAGNQQFYDDKYPAPHWRGENFRLLLAKTLLQAGRKDEAAAALALARERAAAVPGPRNQNLIADLLQWQALAAQALGQDGRRLIAEACTTLVAVHGADAPPSLRCLAHQAWLQGLRAADEGAIQAFDQSSIAYATRLPTDHVVAAERLLLRAELLAAAGRRAEAQAQRIAGAALWAQAMGRPWPGTLVALH